MTLWRLLLGFVLLAIAIQVIRPARTNPPENSAKTIYTNLTVDPAVASILERSCKDCHSDHTVWPWYSGVAPASWMVIHHVNDGRGKMNFSEWGGYDAGETQALLARMCREVSQDHMPLSSYTLIHRNAFLTDADRRAICDWTQHASH